MSESLFGDINRASKKEGPTRLDAAMMDRVDRYFKAGVKRLPDAGSWYENTVFNIQNIFHQYDDSIEDSDQLAYLFIDLLAATSPRCSIIRNTFLTTQIFSFINDAILCKIKMQFEAHINNVCRALLGFDLSGQKVTSFQANLLGDTNAVTIDTWMMRVFGKSHDNPSAKEYEELAGLTRKVAKKYGVTPSAMQAALWVGIKALDGDPTDTPEPFEDTLARFKARQDQQGALDFAPHEDKFKSDEAKLAKGQEKSNPEPRYSSPLVIGPRLREIAVREGGYPGELVDIICEQPSGFMMTAILFCRQNVERWTGNKGDPIDELEIALEVVAERGE